MKNKGYKNTIFLTISEVVREGFWESWARTFYEEKMRRGLFLGKNLSEEIFKENLAAEAAMEQEAREDKLNAHKQDCTSFGFTPDSDAHAQCVMQLAIAEEAQAASSAEVARLESAISAREAAQAAAVREAVFLCVV